MSSGSTSNYSLSYPVPTDPVNVAADIKSLADNIDFFLTAPAFINNLAIDGGSLVTDAITANLFNTNVTTLNIGGSATAVNIGNTAGQANFAGHVNVATGKVYEVNNVTVLSSTTLGSSVVSSSLTSVGTITTGTWSATTIAANKGGTGLTSYAVGDIVYASGTTTLAKLADVATGNALLSGGVGVAPSWGKVSLTTHVSGTLPVANGGTGITSFGANIATWLGTPSSANLLAAVTDETGSGSLVFNSSPAFTGGVIFGDGITNEGRITSALDTFYIQAGTSSSDTTAKLNIARWATGNSNISEFKVYSDSSTFFGSIAAQSATIVGDISSQGNRIIMKSATTGSPTDSVSFIVERGTSADVQIRWNETGDAWQFTNDGTNYFDIPTSAGGGAGLEAVLMFAGM